MSRNAAVSACEKGQAWHLALALLVPPNVVGWSAAMSACARARRWQEALELFSGMPRQQLRPDLAAQSTAVFACERAACWRGALELLCPDPVAYTSGMQACTLAREPEAKHVRSLIKYERRQRRHIALYGMYIYSHRRYTRI